MYHKVTGYVSARHPFHDYVPADAYDFDVASIDKQYESVRGFGCSSCRMGDDTSTIGSAIPWLIALAGGLLLLTAGSKPKRRRA